MREKNMKFTVDVYQKRSGRIPLRDFIDTLSGDGKAEFTKFLTDFMESDDLSIFYIKAIRNKIFEAKQGAFRILFFYREEQMIIITSAYRKKTKKIPADELETAERYRADYLSQQK